jgi:hypothetical protein
LAGCQALLSGLGGAVGSGLTVDEGRQAADQAIETLRQAVKDGYRNLGGMQTDPCLDPLRRRADFQKLLVELGAKEKAKGP